MKKLKKYLLDLKHIDKIELEGVKPHRRAVFASGVAQLLAIMKVLGIERLDYSDGALREGVMYDMLGRQSHEDVKERTILAMAERYFVSQKQATLVYDTALRLFNANKDALGLDDSFGELLGYSARLHEIGLAISHSNYHQHSSYLLQYSDMFGFSSADQEILSALVLYHRRKLRADSADFVKKLGTESLLNLCLLLRLAVLAHQARSRHSAKIDLAIKKGQWQITIGAGNHQELIAHQLQADATQFAKWGVKLVVSNVIS